MPPFTVRPTRGTSTAGSSMARTDACAVVLAASAKRTRSCAWAPKALTVRTEERNSRLTAFRRSMERWRAR